MTASYHHGDLHRALVEDAIALIADKGAAELSLRRVAKRVGVSHAAPYRHFPTKEHLLAAIGAQGFETLGAALKQVPMSLTWVRDAAQVYMDFALAHPAHFQVMFSVPLSRTEHEALGNAGRAALDGLVYGLTQAQAAGHVRSGDPTELAITAWSTVHGLASLLTGGALPEARFGSASHVVERILPHILASFAADAPGVSHA